MKKLLLLTMLMPVVAFGQSESGEDNQIGGYSYFSFGYETVNYEERQSDTIRFNNRDVPYKISTDGKVASPTIRAGGLYRVSNTLDFSMDGSATFAPEVDRETWLLDIELPELNISGENEVQTNDFSFTDATNTGLLHYKYTENWRLVTGAEFLLHTFKRANIEAKPPVEANAEFSEEVVANINVLAGLAYESDQLRGSSSQLSAKLLFGVPVWADVLNSENTHLEFNETGGYSINAEARYTFKITQGFNLGVFAAYRLTERDRQSQSMMETLDGVIKTTVVSIPEATTSSVALGLTMAWDL